MIKKNVCPVAAGVLLALGVFGVGPVLAQDSGEHPTFDRSPAEGPPGTVIRVSGTGCIYYGKPWERAGVSLYNPNFAGTIQYYPIHSDGTWGGDFLIAKEAPVGNYTLEAHCIASDMVLRAGELPFKVAYPPSPGPSTAPSISPSPRLKPSLFPTKAASSPTATVTGQSPSPSLVPQESRQPIAAPANSKTSSHSAGPIFAAVGALLIAALSAVALIYLRRYPREEKGNPPRGDPSESRGNF